MIYTIDPLEMTCTCPYGRFKGNTKLCRHIRPILFRGQFYTDAEGKSRFRVWKEDGKDRWFAAGRYKGFVGDSLPAVMEAIGGVK